MLYHITYTDSHGQLIHGCIEGSNILQVIVIAASSIGWHIHTVEDEQAYHARHDSEQGD